MRSLLPAFFCLLLSGICGGVLAGVDPGEVVDRGRPNLMLIVLDDAGFSDVSGFGRDDAPTPNLEKLANEGVRFTRHYADATCRPARLALMTGKMASRVAMIPDFRGISPEVDTLPELLKQGGYSTHHIGKWHLGDTHPLSWPDAQGFDSWFGFLNQFLLRGPDESGEFSYRLPTYRNPWLQGSDLPPSQYNGHLTDILADAVVDKVQQLAGSEQPWFINYWLFAPHNPSVADRRFLKRHPDTDAGRYEALLEQMDEAVGRVISALEDTAQLENTLIVVLSDNGSTNKAMDSNAPYAGHKGLLFEGALRTPMIIRGPGHFLPGTSFDGIVAIQDVFPTLLQAAGLPVPGDLDGLALDNILVQGEAPRRDLFWDFGSVHLFNYGMLEAGGEWRLHHDDLLHLASEPSGATNVASQYPDKHTALKQQLVDWRDQAHRMSVEYQPLSDTGRAKVSGDSMRRTPGFGGFTLALEVVLPEAGPVTDEVLFTQPGQWSLVYTPGQRFRLELNGASYTSSRLGYQSGDCQRLVLSTYYLRSKLNQDIDKSLVTLWLDGRAIIDETAPDPALFDEDILEPTWVGQNPDGGQVFSGKLGEPYWFNEFFYRDDPWKVGRDLQRVENLLCP